MKAKTTSRLVRLFAAAVAVVVLACLMCTPAFAVNEAVNNCANGVLQVNLVYTDDNGSALKVSSGTGFLVNDVTLVTCYHVVFLDDEDLATLAAMTGKTVKEVQNRLSITVTVRRDSTIPAQYLNGSAEMDFAFIKVNTALPTKTPLTMRESSTLKQTERIWSLGFPVMDALMQSYSTYTAEDVRITDGTVTKLATGTNLYSGANTDYVQTDCNIDYGNSGGPMVDEDGNVVGISQGVYALSDDPLAATFYNAIAIDQVIGLGRDLGIDMDVVGAPAATEPTEEDNEQTAEPTEATEATEPSLPPLDTNADEKGNGMMWILIAAVAVVVAIIVVVVILILVGGKKKAPANETFTPPAPPAPPIPPARPMTPPAPPTGNGFSAPPTFPMPDAGETSVLNAGNAGETTVLSRNAVNAGSLIRKKNGESVTINAEQFVIGRDRKSVNYCIADNSSVSRNHAKIQVRGGVAYLVDMGAANGTFVNGVKAVARQEVELKNGDKILFADEEFEFKK